MEPVVSGAKNLAVGSLDDGAKAKYEGTDETYVKKLEAKVASLEKARKKDKAGSEEHIAFLESRLDEANRLAKFLNGKKTKMTIEKQQLEERAKVLEEELIRLRDVEQKKESVARSGEQNDVSADESLTAAQKEQPSPKEISNEVVETVASEAEAEAEANTSSAPAAAVNCTTDPSEVENLGKEISELQSRLVIANKVAEYLKKTVAEANDKNSLGNDRVIELEKQVEAMKVQFSGYEEEINNKKFKLAESKRILQFASTNLQNVKKEKAEMEEEHEMEMEEKDKELEFIKGQLEASQTALESTQAEKAELEDKLMDIDYKLQESNRVSKYMQDTAVRLGEERKDLKCEVESLESELAETRQSLTIKIDELEAVMAQASEQNSTVAELLSKVEDYESQLSVSKKTLDFLQLNLSNAERETHSSNEEAAKSIEELSVCKNKVNELENEVRSKNFKLAESKRILGFVEGKVKNITEEKEQQEQDYKSELADVQNKLTETKRILSFVKEKLTRDVEQYKEESHDKDVELDALKSELSDLTSKAEYLQDIVVRVGKEKEDLDDKNQQLTNEVARLANLSEIQGNQLNETVATAKAHESNALGLAKQVADLEGRMKVTDQLVEYLENEWRMALIKLEEQSS